MTETAKVSDRVPISTAIKTIPLRPHPAGTKAIVAPVLSESNHRSRDGRIPKSEARMTSECGKLEIRNTGDDSNQFSQTRHLAAFEFDSELVLRHSSLSRLPLPSDIWLTSDFVPSLSALLDTYAPLAILTRSANRKPDQIPVRPRDCPGEVRAKQGRK